MLSCKFQTISDSVYDNERLYYHNDTIKIYNWFGNKRFFPADKAEKQAVRKELGISKDSFVIISVGGCSVNKRHHDIIKALPDLLKEKNNLMYLHLGQGDDFRFLIKTGIVHAERREHKLVKRIRKAFPICPCHGHAKYAVAAPSARGIFRIVHHVKLIRYIQHIFIAYRAVERIPNKLERFHCTQLFLMRLLIKLKAHVIVRIVRHGLLPKQQFFCRDFGSVPYAMRRIRLKKTGDEIIIIGFVYAPEMKKKILIKQLEAAISTIK